MRSHPTPKASKIYQDTPYWPTGPKVLSRVIKYGYLHCMMNMQNHTNFLIAAQISENGRVDISRPQSTAASMPLQTSEGYDIKYLHQFMQCSHSSIWIDSQCQHTNISFFITAYNKWKEYIATIVRVVHMMPYLCKSFCNTLISIRLWYRDICLHISTIEKYATNTNHDVRILGPSGHHFNVI